MNAFQHKMLTLLDYKGLRLFTILSFILQSIIKAKTNYQLVADCLNSYTLTFKHFLAHGYTCK